LRDPQGVAREIGDVCATVGFFYVKNHGVPGTWSNACTRPRGSSSTADREKAAPERRQLGRNVARLHPAVPRERRPEQHPRPQEAFDFGVHHEDVSPFFGPNSMPSGSELPGFKETCDEYHGAMMALARRLVSAFRPESRPSGGLPRGDAARPDHDPAPPPLPIREARSPRRRSGSYEHRRRERRDPPPMTIDGAHLADAVAAAPRLGDDAHPFRDVEARAPEVHGATTATRFRSQFDRRGLVPEAMQPIRERADPARGVAEEGPPATRCRSACCR
jgi:non-haem dioxygenase in morphine synthesis N-terminal